MLSENTSNSEELDMRGFFTGGCEVCCIQNKKQLIKHNEPANQTKQKYITNKDTSMAP
jgi:hypothetical protein